MRVRAIALAAVVGAAAAYLFDPISGRARRDRLRALMETLSRLAERSMEDLAAHPEGTVLEPPDDATIVQEIRMKLARRPDLQTEDLVIDVVRGVAYLRGAQIDRRGFDEVVDLTSSVPGVRRVQSLLHLPER